MISMQVVKQSIRPLKKIICSPTSTFFSLKIDPVLEKKQTGSHKSRFLSKNGEGLNMEVYPYILRYNKNICIAVNFKLLRQCTCSLITTIVHNFTRFTIRSSS